MEALAQRTFEDIKATLHKLGTDVVAPAAILVDQDARFPEEAFAAFREHQLLSTYIPQEFGGDGLSISQICELCRILGSYCGSTAMIFAMHQIQVACIVHHAGGSEYFRQFMARIHSEQLLLASATTEIGVGGDLRSSICHVDVADDGNFTLEKKAPVISYALNADAILVTCRTNAEAPASDQVQVVLNKGQYELEPISGWDTMGFRGTCSSGFVIKGTGHKDQIQPMPFSQILAHSMHPVSHLTWGSLWTGLAQGAVNKARQSVRDMMRRSNELPQITATRLAELDEVMFSMKGGLFSALEEYQDILDSGNLFRAEKYGFSIQVNNVKTRCSEMIVDIISRAMLIVGIGGYRNDGKYSLCRELRDAYGAALMVNNDRIRGHNATMQVAIRES
ncbi:acyl-CoA dehydrogenase family protein [Reinekea blandensis]|uniref:Acyl-CoA dehydrogenase n=1 Tax=Reinekea blandensis MED297 TaxID=314283 RepID=A4B958_9GAMM|nr:acyl-CoA dehydrogenase family protein [Reinekea blandensis]EAR11159.1 acyl-CoA dehydrogenase [Reinekea sp. MED297] [Reinekea blandensis MED297]